jgi:hypothetical protein
MAGAIKPIDSELNLEPQGHDVLYEIAVRERRSFSVIEHR